MTKRTLSVLLALCLLLSAAAPAVAANDDGAALTPLAAPSNLRWSRDGAWGPGEMTWDIDGAFQGKLEINIYREGNGKPVFSTLQEYEADDRGPFSTEHFIVRALDGDEESLESGSYYFTIQNIGDEKTYASSAVVSSKDMPDGEGVYLYVRPEAQLEKPQKGHWEWPAAVWDDKQNDDERIRAYYIEYGFSETEGGQIEIVGNTNDIKSGEADFWLRDVVIGITGDGYYYFRVKPISRNIEQTQNGEFSPWSEAYNLKAENRDTLDALYDLTAETDVDYIREQLKEIGQQKLYESLQADLQNVNGAAGLLRDLEAIVGGPANAQVSPELTDFPEDKISIVGAMLNTQDGAGDITLHVGKAQQNHIRDEMYDSVLAVDFSMTLANVADPENLEVPVKITLPIPQNMNPGILRILHYRQDGTHEDVVTEKYQKDGQWYVSFVLTSFSDFTMTQRLRTWLGTNIIKTAKGLWITRA